MKYVIFFLFGFSSVLLHAQNEVDSAVWNKLLIQSEYRDSIESISLTIKYELGQELGAENTLLKRRGDLYFIIEDYNLAVNDYEKVRKNSFDVGIVIANKIAICRYKLGYYSKAWKAFNDILSKDSIHFDANYYMALIYSKKKDFKSAASYLNRIYNELLSGSNFVHEELFNIAEIYYRLNQDEKAVNLYNKIINRDSIITEVIISSHMQRGKCYYKLNLFEKAEIDYTKVIMYRPEDKFAYYLRAYSRFEIEKYNAALVDINFSIDYYNDGSEHYIRGQIYDKLGQYNNALADFNYAIKKEYNKWSYLLLADSYMSLQDNHEALKTIEKGLKKNPDFNELLYKKGIVLFRTYGKSKDACSCIKNAISLGYKNYDIELTEEICK